MNFVAYESFKDHESHKKRVWDWLKEAFHEHQVIVYYKYPIFVPSKGCNIEPDLVILHREFGLWVIQCQAYKIDNIAEMGDDIWLMNNWENEEESPITEVEEQARKIKQKLDDNKSIRDKITYHFRVALPNIKKSEWETKGFNTLPQTTNILVYENLTPAAFKEYLKQNANTINLSDDEWESATGMLRGTLSSTTTYKIPTGTAPDNPIRIIKEIETKIKFLDDTQQKIAFEIPQGPQRLRGLAGTGKTVLLAKKAAKLHIKYPDWTIGFVFFTRSLYDQITQLVTHYYKEMKGLDQDPDWEKLKIIHAWGDEKCPGFYSILCQKYGLPRKKNYDAERESQSKSPAVKFDYVCQDLLDKINQKTVYSNFDETINDDLALYDALLVDEGQDLPKSFYQLAYQSLLNPKRLYWAYDEAQGIGSLMIPNSESIFGRNPDKSLVVDLSGVYEGGIFKTHKMKKCYRTPRLLLMTAHAINMGLFRPQGPLQGVTRKTDWEDLGYQVISGDFRSIGKPIEITRPDAESPHPIDQPNFVKLSNLIIQSFDNRKEEQKWIAQQIVQDIQLGFKPHDILITALSGDDGPEYLKTMKQLLEAEGISGFIAGDKDNSDVFRKLNHITISDIYRAKGNEAWKVYASRFEYATKPLTWKDGEQEIHKRNEAFVALTRAKVWCVVTGVNPPIFRELEEAIKQYPNFTFLAFNKESLKRNMNDNDTDEEAS